jgi:hypothetical protein
MEAVMTYKGYNPTSMPADAPLQIQYPEVKAPQTEGREPESRQDA